MRITPAENTKTWRAAWFFSILPANSRTVASVRPWPLLFASFSARYVSTVVSFDAVWPETLTSSLNKQVNKQINNTCLVSHLLLDENGVRPVLQTWQNVLIQRLKWNKSMKCAESDMQRWFFSNRWLNWCGLCISCPTKQQMPTQRNVWCRLPALAVLPTVGSNKCAS
jgi:hypothetical protein